VEFYCITILHICCFFNILKTYFSTIGFLCNPVFRFRMYIFFMHVNTFFLEEVRRLYQTVKGVHGTNKVKKPSKSKHSSHTSVLEHCQFMFLPQCETVYKYMKLYAYYISLYFNSFIVIYHSY
jgi:hypothetical protein